MEAKLCLFTCALLMAQSADRNEWRVQPRLTLGQELLYRGSFQEDAVGKSVQFSRAYRFENRLFVLDTQAEGYDIAVLTSLRQRLATADRLPPSASNSVRLEFARLSEHGRLNQTAGSLAVPLDGPPTAECGAFLEVPGGLIRLNQSWESIVAGGPARMWKVLDTEILNNTTCLKIEGFQQSDDWTTPRADRTAWRRRDVVWLDPNQGIAYKLERTIERRNPAHREPSQRSILQYELQSNMQYPGKLFEDRRREILQASKLYKDVLPYLSNPGRYGKAPFDAALARIAQHLDSYPGTPYRDAVLLVKRRVEAGRRGEPLPAVARSEAEPTTGAAVGERAPDFVATNLISKQTVGLNRWLGKPILLVFYSPRSRTVDDMLHFGQELQDNHATTAAVIGLAVSDDADLVRQQHRDLQLTIPLLSGRGLRQVYGVESTPTAIVVDSLGIVHGRYVGWGPETITSVREDLKSCKEKASRLKSGSTSQTTGNRPR